MERKIEKQLFEWKARKNRLPLVLQGARQVGKTYSMLKFGKVYYKNTAYFNFESSTELQHIFDRDLSPIRIIRESSGKAELDFVIQNKNGEVIPIEVKSSENVRSKSLQQFITRYSPPWSIRISAKNFGFENKIKSVPLYSAFCI